MNLRTAIIAGATFFGLSGLVVVAQQPPVVQIWQLPISPTAPTLTGSELVAMWQGSNTFQTTMSSIAQYTEGSSFFNNYITGPASATSGNFAAFSGVTGKVVQDSGLTTGTSGNSIPTNNGGFTQSGTANFTGAFQIGGIGQAFPVSGLIVGTTDTQNLTNKSIAASEINSGQLAIANGGTGSSTLAGASIVTGPASATSGHLATFNGGTGKIVQDSGVSLAAPGAIGATTPGAATFTGVTLSTTTGIVGATTNNAAAAGSVGEDILATVAVTATGLSSGTTANIASISLTAGDWEVFGSACFGFGNATSLTIALSQVSAGSAPSSTTMSNNTGSIASWYSATTPAIVSSGGGFCLSTIITRISLASTTTEILWENATFTTSTLGGYGTIEARRLR